MTRSKMSSFGVGSLSERNGYDLPLLVGHLESLVSEEQEKVLSGVKMTAKENCRLKRVEEALNILGEVLQLYPE